MASGRAEGHAPRSMDQLPPVLSSPAAGSPQSPEYQAISAESLTYGGVTAAVATGFARELCAPISQPTSIKAPGTGRRPLWETGAPPLDNVVQIQDHRDMRTRCRWYPRRELDKMITLENQG